MRSLPIRILLVIITTSLLPLAAPAQTIQETGHWEDDAPDSAEERSQFFQDILENPLNLNRISLEALYALPFLSPHQARDLVRERESGGGFHDWKQVRIRMNWPRDFLQRIRPFFTLSEPGRNSRPADILTRHLISLPAAQGIRDGAYAGSGWKRLVRIRLPEIAGVRGSVLIEKDPGESSIFDHTQASIEIHRGNSPVRMVLGDFLARFGQGLVLWGPFSPSRSGSPGSLLTQHHQGFLSRVNSLEYGFFRGAGLEFIRNPGRVSAWITRTPRDATLDGDGFVTSLSATGMHRTVHELERKHAIRENMAGISARVTLSDGSIGVTGWGLHYSHPVRYPDSPRYRFAFHGKDHCLLGTDFELHRGDLSVSGEAAVCSGTGRAFKAGVLFKKGRTRLSGSVWHAESGFFNPHSASGGNHPVSNETGLYAGMETRLFTSLLISLAMTATRTPWRTYFQTMPVTFQELLFSWQHQPLSGLTYAFRIRQRCRESYRLSDDPPPGLDSVFMLESESRYRFELTCSHVYSIQGKFRAELVTLENMESWSFSNSTPVRESGWLMFGEMIIRPLRMLDIRTRLIMFHTASYQSRIYTYEPDLPGVMAIPFFYGRGRRVMLRIRLAWKKRCALTVKCAATTHPSQGTGTEPSPGKKEYDAGFQVQLFLPCRSERP